MTYGIETLPEGDPYIELAERAMSTLGEVSVPGAYLVDFFPVCTSHFLYVATEPKPL